MLLTVVRIIYASARVSFKKDKLYIKDTIMLIAFNITILIVQFAFFRFIYGNVPSIKYVSFNDMMFLLSTQQIIEIFYYTLFFRSFVAMNSLIGEGKFDYFLIIPRNRQLLLNLWELDLKELVGIIFPLFLLFKYGFCGSIKTVGIYLVLILVGLGIRTYFGMFIRNLTIAAVKVLSLQNLESVIFGYASLPYVIYKGIFKLVFMLIIPVGIVANMAYGYIIRNNKDIVLVGILLLIVLYTLSTVTFKGFLKLYQSAGG